MPELTPLSPFNPDSVDAAQVSSADTGFKSAANAAADIDLKVLCTIIYYYLYVILMLNSIIVSL